MQHYLARDREAVRTAWVPRFLPRLWSVDFPRPMMASLTTPAVDTIRVDLEFLTGNDLAGLIWASEDRWSHPLLSYDSVRDYRGLRLEFRWVAGPGLMPLDSLFGPVLTVEGRDADGEPRVWYVRLWNHAEGEAGNAIIRFDFDDLRAGFGQEDEQLVYCGDIDRMFISLVPAAFSGEDAALPAEVATWVELRDLRAIGPQPMLRLGDAFLPEHGLRICSGYDDSYHQSPERLVEQWQALGYRGVINHYVGMSHYYRLRAAGLGRFEVADGLCAPGAAWHRALLKAAKAAGYEVILSLSMELFDANAPGEWAQRNAAGQRALTGWEPPSTLLSPCHVGAMNWLRAIAAAFMDLAEAEAVALHFQVGEPWWWVGVDGAPCFYDAATEARWLLETGSAAPRMTDVLGARSAGERDFLDWLGARLAEATAGLAAAARAGRETPVRSHLLFYAPQVLVDDKPDLKRANMPVGWARPAFDVLQLEDYDFVIEGDEAGMALARRAVADTLGYPVQEQHYLSGFVLNAADGLVQWPRIAAAADQAVALGVPEVFVWAWPQVARDGFTAFDLAFDRDDKQETGPMDAFHDVVFPLELGFGAVGGPEFRTQVATMASGYEQRNMDWARARLRYDVGTGVRSDADMAALMTFFRGRRGQAHAFRFRDPVDHSSRDMVAAPTAFDQLLGVGDGATLSFPLVKHYDPVHGGEVRRITRPVNGSVAVAVGGVVQATGWVLLAGGVVQFAQAPAVGAEVRAGFLFDVPMRFAEDQLSLSLAGWRAGEVPSIGLVEVRE